jgi:hypothetical protein
MSKNERKSVLEPMPEALLAEMFAGGIVVIPGEFEQKEVKSKIMPATPKMVEEATLMPAAPVFKNQILPVDDLSWLGSFGKKVLVVVQDSSALHINENDLEFLAKILGAVKLSMADIALVNAARYALTYQGLQEKLPAQVAFYFGIAPVEIGAPLSFPQFQVQKWNNTTFLYAPALGELNKNTADAIALKKELWAALKKIF